MKESTKRTGLRVYYITLGVSFTGVGIAGLGILIKHDTLYYTGLVLAFPLFVTVLPIGVLLIALMPVATVLYAITWLWARISGGRPRGKCEAKPKERNRQ